MTATWPEINEMSVRQPGEIALCPPIVSHKKKMNTKILKQADNILQAGLTLYCYTKGTFFLAALDPKVIVPINFHQWEKNYSTETYRPASI